MSGLLAQEELKRSIGHFKGGEVTSNDGGESVVSFAVNIDVTEGLLVKFNELCNGIPGCIRTDGAGERQIHVVFDSSMTLNEVTKSALRWRNKVIASPSVSRTRGAAIPQLVFSHA